VQSGFERALRWPSERANARSEGIKLGIWSVRAYPLARVTAVIFVLYELLYETETEGGRGMLSFAQAKAHHHHASAARSA
jgi:hypothetical protein